MRTSAGTSETTSAYDGAVVLAARCVRPMIWVRSSALHGSSSTMEVRGPVPLSCSDRPTPPARERRATRLLPLWKASTSSSRLTRCTSHAAPAAPDAGGDEAARPARNLGHVGRAVALHDLVDHVQADDALLVAVEHADADADADVDADRGAASGRQRRRAVVLLLLLSLHPPPSPAQEGRRRRPRGGRWRRRRSTAATRASPMRRPPLPPAATPATAPGTPHPCR